MAEIGIIASIFSVATFGTQLAKGLYTFSDDVRNSRRQIRRFAKKVAYLSNALIDAKRTLRAERGSYNKDAENAIRTVIRSCRDDFREIDETLEARRLRRLSWLFKKSKAEELLRSLETHTSTVQFLMQGITLSTMLRSSRQQKEEITNLVESMQTLARTNQELALQLKTAESKLAPEPPPDLSSGNQDAAHADDHSVYSYEDDQTGNSHKTKNDTNNLVMTGSRPQHPKPPTPTSDKLLQVIPWNPPPSYAPPPARTQDETAQRSKEKSKDPTEMVSFLIKTYTTAPANSLTQYIKEEPNQTVHKYEPTPTKDYSKDPFLPPYGDDYPDSDLSSGTDSDGPDERTWDTVRDCFDDNKELSMSSSGIKLQEAGKSFLSALRKKRGNFFWMKGNDSEVTCYSGPRKFYTYRLRMKVPYGLPYGGIDSFTRIAKGLVREEFLRLHHWHFWEVDGHYHICEALAYHVVKGLVELSAGAMETRMIHHAQNPMTDPAGYPTPSMPSSTLPPMPAPMPPPRTPYVAPSFGPPPAGFDDPYDSDPGAGYFGGPRPSAYPSYQPPPPPPIWLDSSGPMNYGRHGSRPPPPRPPRRSGWSQPYVPGTATDGYPALPGEPPRDWRTMPVVLADKPPAKPKPTVDDSKPKKPPPPPSVASDQSSEAESDTGSEDVSGKNGRKNTAEKSKERPGGKGPAKT